MKLKSLLFLELCLTQEINRHEKYPQELEKHFSEELCTTVIPRNVKLSEAPSYGMPALYYEPEAKGTIAYLALAGELINKYEKNSAA